MLFIYLGIAEVIVAVGGEDDKVVLRSVECFDPINDKWLTLACLPFAISKHGVVVTGMNFYKSHIDMFQNSQKLYLKVLELYLDNYQYVSSVEHCIVF